MAKYRRKPDEVEAVEFTGSNHTEVYDFMDTPVVDRWCPLRVKTIDGDVHPQGGSMIVKADEGGFYVPPMFAFQETYELVKQVR